MGQIIGAHSQAVLADETDRIYEWIEPILQSGPGPVGLDQLEVLTDRALNKYRSRRGRDGLSPTVLVVQAPNLTCRPDELAASFPGSRVIYMLRDVRAVVASMQRLSNIPFVNNQIRFFKQAGFIEQTFPDEWFALIDPDTDESVRMALVARIKMSLAGRFEAAGISTLSIHYEALVSRQRDTVELVLDHLDLPFDEQCLSHDDLLTGFGPGGTDRSKAITSSSLSKWSSQLSPETVAEIWSAVGDFYEGLGYRRDADAPDSRQSG